jgi:dolichyl-phosphate-mannose-protein mannosyltransferase
MVRPVYYWVRDFAGGTTGRIYALGNPAVWWGSTLGFIAALFLWRPKRREKKWILYAGYLIHMIPFFFITRVIFLYHYLPALGFAVAILAGWLFDDGAERRGKQLLWMLIAAGAMAGFLFFAPLSYGLPLSESQYTMRVWLSSWR